MSRNSSKIETIEQIKKRGAHWADIYSAAYAVEQQITSIMDAADAAPEQCLELWKYFPIAAVTCLENSTRWAINYLVECGEQFKEQATQLVSGQFSIKDLMPLIGRRISFGDLVAHLVSVNSLQDINAHLTTLMGKDANGKQRDFLAELKEFRSFDSTILGSDSESEEVESILLPNPEQALPAIKRIFEVRHIIVHELTPPDIAQPTEIKGLLVQVSKFIHAVHYFVLELGDPGSTAMYQASMNIGAWQRYESTLLEMGQALNEVDSRLAVYRKDKQAELRAAQKQFMRFVAAEARFYLNPFEGGSGASMMEAGYRTSLIHFRIQQLKRHLEFVIDPEAAYLGISPNEGDVQT